MRISLIVSTYNWKDALELTLLSTARQSEPPHEVIVADDGSDADTAELIAAVATKIPAPVAHVWHEDLGFRLAAIRNRAMAQATGDYLVQVDGDLILHRHFLRDHRRAARPGWFIRGARAPINEVGTRLLLEARSIDVHAWSPGVKNRIKGIRSRSISQILRRIRMAKGVLGCNMSFWREDVIRVNGYDERMVGWGREDEELCVRMEHAGVRYQELRFSGLVYHLHHPERPRDRHAANFQMLTETRATKRTSCEMGISQYLP